VRFFPYRVQRAGGERGDMRPCLVPAARRERQADLEATVVPLIHHRPVSGLQGKFSLEYADAAALLDAYPGFGSFTDSAVRRDAAQQVVGLVEVKSEPGGNWLLDGQLEADVHTSDGTIPRASQQFPPGSPARPALGRAVAVQAGRVRARAGH
jgi:hypothetical protein